LGRASRGPNGEKSFRARAERFFAPVEFTLKKAADLSKDWEDQATYTLAI
jgi:hypothetical protein